MNEHNIESWEALSLLFLSTYAHFPGCRIPFFLFLLTPTTPPPEIRHHNLQRCNRTYSTASISQFLQPQECHKMLLFLCCFFTYSLIYMQDVSCIVQFFQSFFYSLSIAEKLEGASLCRARLHYFQISSYNSFQCYTQWETLTFIHKIQVHKTALFISGDTFCTIWALLAVFCTAYSISCQSRSILSPSAGKESEVSRLGEATMPI